MDDPLIRHLGCCCVRVQGRTSGTGFFVAPGVVLTCAHVVGAERLEGDSIEGVRWGTEEDQDARIVQILPASDEDLALVKVKFSGHPCVFFDTHVLRGDPLYAWGFPDYGRGALHDGVAGEYEGRTGIRETCAHSSFHKFAKARVIGGFSGGPLLNIRTGRVIGIVTETQGSSGPLGGWAIPTELVIDRFNDIVHANTTFHLSSCQWEHAFQEQIKLQEEGGDAKRQAISGATRALPAARQIENFIAHYVGSPNRPEPFGGRTLSLESLAAWLNESESPPYMLLSAPAGRGKSALLVRWIMQLRQTEPDLHVIFVPISVRYELNSAQAVFGALVARLAALHGRDWGGIRAASVEELCDYFAEYINLELPEGHRLLIVLDGLDEAASWDVNPGLFPMRPAAKVRVLLSARHTANRPQAHQWLEQLRWNDPSIACTLGLEPLEVDGVRDVMERIGEPLDQLAREPEIVNELYRLSLGDPLLLSLYVKDLWTEPQRGSPIGVEDLAKLRPGIDGYLARWWEDQEVLWGESLGEKQAEVAVVFNILATSFGPLERRDLLRLANSRASMDGSRMDAALRSLKRFIVLDTNQRAYVLAHPRFAMHRFEQLRADGEHKSYELLFLEWGRQVLADLRASKAESEPSPYIVQFYSAHLKRAGCEPGEFLELVQPAWQRAWEVVCEEYDGFLSDLETAWEAAAQADRSAVAAGCSAPWLGQQLRCALIRADLTAQSDVIRAGLLAGLVRFAVWSCRRALNYTREIEDKCRRATAISAIAPYVRAESLPILLTLLHQLAPADPEDYGPALAACCCRLFEVGQHEKALELLRSEPHGYARGYAIVEAFSYLSGDERRKLFGGIERDIAEIGGRHLILLVKKVTLEIARGEAAAVLGDDPWRLVQPFVNTYGLDSGERLAAIAAWLPEPETTICNFLRSCADEMLHPHSLYSATDFVDLAPHIRGKVLPLAFELANLMKRCEDRAATLLAIWPFLSLQERSLAKEAILDAIDDALKMPGTDDARAFFARLILAGFAKEAFAALSSPHCDAYRLADLIEGVADNLDEQQVRHCLVIANRCPQYAIDRARGSLLARLATFGAQQAKDALALTQVTDISEALLIARSFLRMEVSEPRNGKEFLVPLTTLREPQERFEAVMQAAAQLHGLGAEEFIVAVESFGETRAAVESIEILCPLLPFQEAVDSGIVGVVEHVVRAARHENKEWYVRHFFRRLAECDNIELALYLANIWSDFGEFEPPLVACILGVAHQANSETWSEILDIVQHLSEPYSKAVGIAAVLEHFGNAQSNWDELIECFETMLPEHRSCSTALVIDALPPTVRDVALSLLISDEYLNGEESVYIEDGGLSQATALHNLVPVLPKTMIDKVLKRSGKFRSGSGRAMLECALSRRLATLGFPEEAFARSGMIGDAERRGQAIAAVLRHAPVSMVPEVMDAAFDRWQDRLFIWRAVVSRWTELPPSEILQVVENWLRHMAKTSRRELLADLRGFASALHLLGGEVAINQTLAAIDESP